MVQLVCQKSNDDLQISSEEAIMAVNNEVLFMNQLQLTNSFLQMKQYIVYVIFLLMVMSERMFVIVGAFLFRYCLGYYSFEIFKYKNKKHETNEVSSSYNKKYGMQYGFFGGKTRQNKNQ